MKTHDANNIADYLTEFAKGKGAWVMETREHKPDLKMIRLEITLKIEDKK